MRPVARFYRESFFPLTRASQLSAQSVQNFLRTCFETWGFPLALRFDNGAPWATQSDIPSALALWILGFGVRVLLNRPAQSTDNAIVERSHGTLAKWLEPQYALSIEQLQSQMEAAIRIQRTNYPVAEGKSRLELYPNLERKLRNYQADLEAELWQMEAVFAALGQRIWQRRVDKVGRISFFSHSYSVGRAYRAKRVSIRLDPQNHDWLIEDEQGKLLKRYVSKELCPERILTLSLSKRANSLSTHTG